MESTSFLRFGNHSTTQAAAIDGQLLLFNSLLRCYKLAEMHHYSTIVKYGAPQLYTANILSNFRYSVELFILSACGKFVNVDNASVSVLPCNSSMAVSHLEEEIQQNIKAKGLSIETVYFNKGL